MKHQYTTSKGFFNLTTQPKTLSKKEHEKIQRVQMFLAKQNKNTEYLKKYEPVRWEKLKEISAELQQIIFNHWSLEEIS